MISCRKWITSLQYTILLVEVISLILSHNDRENARGATLIINMIDKTTEIANPAEKNEEPKRFTFDYSYWSHDDFSKRDTDGYLVPSSPKYADQVP